MTTQNFPNCTDPNASPFAWALRNGAEDVALEITECVGDETKFQLAALVALSDRIMKRLNGEDEWKETTLEECLDHTEGNGYWKADTVLDMLKSGQTVFTPFSFYKMENR